jgi:UDP-N-acetyl-2-amino-2-deoxyglucuronate dehydrogenase
MSRIMRSGHELAVPVERALRLGILGTGNISDTHARAAHSVAGVEVVAVCGRHLPRAEALAAEYGAQAYDDVERFLAHRPMEAVAIGTPSGLHAAHAAAAVRHGLGVLIEKPADISTERIDELLRVLSAHPVTAGVFFQDRLKPDILRVKRWVDGGVLGRPVLGSGRVRWQRPASYYADSTWRGTWSLDGGGALMNQAIHTVDLLQWLFGPVARVAARTATRVHGIEAEDTAVAVLEFASGALGTIEAATSVYPGYARRIDLTGVEGTIAIDGDTIGALDLRTPLHYDTALAPATSAGATTARVADASAHAAVIEDFANAIRQGVSPACTVHEGRKSVAIVEAIYRSARDGGIVEVW